MCRKNLLLRVRYSVIVSCCPSALSMGLALVVLYKYPAFTCLILWYLAFFFTSNTFFLCSKKLWVRNDEKENPPTELVGGSNIYSYISIKENALCPSFSLDIPSHRCTFFCLHSLNYNTFFPFFFYLLSKNKMTFVAPVIITHYLDIWTGKMLYLWASNGVM